MQFASSVSTNGDATLAVDELIHWLGQEIDPANLDWMLFFCTPHYEDELTSVAATLSERAPRATLLGCTVEGTIGNGQELQRSCSMSLLGGSLPGVRLHPFHLTLDELDELEDRDTWSGRIGLRQEPTFLSVVLGDPFSFDIQRFLTTANEMSPESPLVGGMASAAEQPGQNRLFLGNQVFDEGLVGVTLAGDFSLRTVVSQGCRPIGKPYVVTRGERNVVRDLGGHPAVAQLNTLIEDLSEADIRLARQALFLGRAIDEYRESFSRGDFLIHNIIGMDPQAGALAIAGPVRVGTTVQFHVRDAESADEDLRTLLQDVSPFGAEAPPAAALLFNCNGRGIRMWPYDGHDIRVLHELCGPIPAGGCFAAGEIGPVGGKNFIHGFTASIALLGQKAAD